MDDNELATRIDFYSTYLNALEQYKAEILAELEEANFAIEDTRQHHNLLVEAVGLRRSDAATKRNQRRNHGQKKSEASVTSARYETESSPQRHKGLRRSRKKKATPTTP